VEDAPVEKRRVALVCANFTMQSALGLLILALNAARLGYETMIYFTFEGLNMIRPGALETLRYVPSGVAQSDADTEHLTLELRARMEVKDIPYPEDMLEMAKYEGVRLLACKTSADLLNLGQGDFVPGVEIMLAKDFMSRAVGSALHLVF
jgi:peroxiredoxin family protein